VAKVYGKSKIYLVNQSLFEKQDCTEIDEKIREHKRRCESLREEVEELNAEILVLDKLLSFEELEKRIAALEQQVANNEARLGELKSGGRAVLQKDMSVASKALAKAAGNYRSVKKIFDNLVEILCEGMDVKKTQLYEDAGIET
jgi:26S proteasome regulatory subunit, ATPase 3, interacting protein